MMLVVYQDLAGNRSVRRKIKEQKVLQKNHQELLLKCVEEDDGKSKLFHAEVLI